MQTFDFSNEVLREFSFLEKGKFRLEEVHPTIVRYVSDVYRINVFYGPRTREIGLEFAPLLLAKQDFHISLLPLISFFDKGAAEVMPIFPPATTKEQVVERVRYLARNFHRYVNLKCLESPEFWPKIKAEAIAIFKKRYSPSSSIS